MMKRYSLKIQFLFSFLFLVVLMAIISYVTLRSNIEVIHSYTAQMTVNTFNSAITDFSSVLSKCEGLSNTAAASIVENNLTLDENRKTRIKIDSGVFSLLNEMKKQLLIVDDLIMYIRGDAYVYTQDTKFPYETYVSMERKEYLLDEANLFTKMLKLNQPSIIAVHSKQDIESSQIAYILPVSCGSFSDLIFVYFIQWDSIVEELNSYVGETNADLYIFDHTLATLFQNRHSIAQPYWNVSSIFKIHGSGLISTSLEKQPVILIREYDKIHDLTFVMLNSAENFYQQSNTSTTEQTLSFIILIIAFLLLAFFLTYINYRPIRKLTNEIGVSISDHFSNELAVIKETYTQTSQALQSLNLIAVDQFMTKLNSNLIHSQDEYDYMLRCCGISLSFSHFTILYILFSSMESNERIEHALSVCRSASFPSASNVVISRVYHESALSVLVNFDLEKGTDTFPLACADALKQSLYRESFQNILIGVGKTYQDPLKLSSSFLEASAAVQLAPMDSGIVFSYVQQKEREAAGVSTSGIPATQKSFFIECIRRGNLEQSLAAFEDIAQIITSQTTSLLLLRFYGAELIQIIISQGELYHQTIPAADIERFLHFNSSREFHQGITRLIRNMCQLIQNQIKANNISKKNETVSYIQVHYMDYDLSVQAVLNHLNISRQQLNEIMKEDIGMGFSQYVSYLRLENFKVLLLETNDNIQSLVARVGYADVPNFLRKFKQSEGITPSQYRLIHKANNARNTAV